MEVRNCKQCGRLYNYIGGSYRNLCPACVEKVEKSFQDVKTYIEDNPGVGINQVSEAMGVPVRQIERWVREERLSFSDDSDIGIPCEKCGRMIKTGRFCKQCADQLGNALNGLYQATHENTSKGVRGADSRMRYIDK